MGTTGIWWPSCSVWCCTVPGFTVWADVDGCGDTSRRSTARVHGARVRHRSLALTLPSLVHLRGNLGFVWFVLRCHFLLLYPSRLLHSLNNWISRNLKVHKFSRLLFEIWWSNLPRINFFSHLLCRSRRACSIDTSNVGSVDISRSYAHKMTAVTQFSRHGYPPVTPALRVRPVSCECLRIRDSFIYTMV
jgi:hypothetical protein